ncbi:MAG: hypothetical protein M1823_003835 [Watsoniomyces obsoletus]|nr:MAG: hypothetical protein M1823_003835 [Watsoniomyces obsoletus]
MAILVSILYTPFKTTTSNDDRMGLTGPRPGVWAKFGDGCFILPKRSGVHRRAGLALYRALLRQTRHVPVPDERRNALQGFVRRSFRQNRNVDSLQLVTKGFNAGYEALDLLRASVLGNTSSTTRILSLLSKLVPVRRSRKDLEIGAREPREECHANIQPSVVQSLDTGTKPAQEASTVEAGTSPADGRRNVVVEVTPSKERRSKPERRKLSPWPGATPVLARPYRNISGRRHIPRLASANGIPFLRIKKPQSPFLSLIIRTKLKKRQRRMDTLEELQGAKVEAELEDQWEGMMAQLKVASLGSSKSIRRVGHRWTPTEPGYVAPIESGIAANVLQHKKERKKNQLMATKMMEIIDKETELAQREERERQTMRGGETVAGRKRKGGDRSKDVSIKEGETSRKRGGATRKLDDDRSGRKGLSK